MNDGNKTQGKMKEKIIHETRLFFFYTLFLFVLFGVFNVYERLLLGDYGNNHIRYGYSLIEALILAKIILLGQALNVGDKFRHLPLVIPVIYKTVIFTVLLLVFNILEHYVTGYIEGNTIGKTYQEVMRQKINIILAKNFIMVIIFAQFFSVLELSRVIGQHKLSGYFFKTRTKSAQDIRE